MRPLALLTNPPCIFCHVSSPLHSLLSDDNHCLHFYQNLLDLLLILSDFWFPLECNGRKKLKEFFLPGTLNFNRNQSLIPVFPNIDLSKNNLESLLKCILMDSNLQESDLIILGEGQRICFD